MCIKTVLFGASDLGKLAYKDLKDKYDIMYYCDNDVNKVGQEFNGLKIISLDNLIDCVQSDDFMVIISSHHYKTITEQLLSVNINEEKIKIFTMGNFSSKNLLYTIEELEKIADISNIVIDGQEEDDEYVELNDYDDESILQSLETALNNLKESMVKNDFDEI